MGFWKDLNAIRFRTGYGAWLISYGFTPDEASEMVQLAEKRDRGNA